MPTPPRRSAPALLLSLALSFALAGTAAAVPIVYDVVTSESNLAASATATYSVDVTPDFSGEFPTAAFASGNSNTQPTPTSTLRADVGLPGNFDGGANGIVISQWDAHFEQLPGTLFPVGFITVPLDLTGSNTQLIGFRAEVSSLNITLDSPLISDLTQSGSEWLWAGTANVTLSGEIAPVVEIPTVETITLDPIPFSQQQTVALAGTFSGDGSGTEVTIGIPTEAFMDVNVPIPVINESIGLPPLVPVVTVDFALAALVFSDISGALVYRDSTPIPEPGTGLLLGLGVAALAWRRRR